MTLPRQWQRHLLALVARARPLEGEFYRSVELSYAHPDDVISGEGSRLHGGRFATPGIRAVYGSFDEPTAVGEAVNRAARLAGHAGISFAGYPRVTYVIAVKLSRHLDLEGQDPDGQAILSAALDANLTASHEVGQFCREQGVQGIAYPSAVAGLNGRNVVVFRDVMPRPTIDLVNRDQIVRELRRIGERLR